MAEMNMEYLGHNRNTSYLARHTTTTKEAYSTMDNESKEFSRIPACERKLTVLPWRPATYYKQEVKSPSSTLHLSVTSPLTLKQSLTELEGIKVPPIFSAARNALYTRYTPNDWLASSMGIYHVSDRSRQHAERVRFDNIRLGKETDDKTKRTQDDVGKKLGDRICDTAFWKKELDREIDKMVKEMNLLQEAERVAAKLLAETENPLHIAEECIYNREKRQRIELVHDHPEKSLLEEIDVIRQCQAKLRQRIKEAQEQQQRNRVALLKMQKDARDKFLAQQIDEGCHYLKNTSAGLKFYPGVETIDNCQSVPETWAKFSNDILKQSQDEREASANLRKNIEETVNQCCDDMWKQWNQVNTDLNSRIQETIDSRNKVQAHLNKVLQEIFDMEKSIEYIKKCILDKEGPMMVAQTRLNSRLARPGMEQCRDTAQHRLVEEVYEIRETVEQLQQRLAEAENSLQILIRSSAQLQNDLNIKNNSIFIDREKCLALRKSFPIAPRMSFTV